MKRKISPGLIWLLWTILSTSFACSAAILVPQLQNRRLAINPDLPALFYEYQECAKEWAGICWKKEWRKDVYDLTDAKVRTQLRDMGVTCTSERRWQ
jgi:hypothetical protein